MMRTLLLTCIALLCGCSQDPHAEVVVYTALDRDFAEPMFTRFTAHTGIAVRAVFDTESTKSLGLANRIRAEAARPRCDVFWNNEILNTLALQHDDLLAPVPSSQAEHLPAAFRDPAGCWYGFAARARVLLVNRDLVSEAELPGSIEDLADARFFGRVAIAKPLFGTTASHLACLFATWGEVRTTAWLDRLKRNGIRIESGNKGCAQAVADGRAAFALTDTDDAIAEVEAGKPVQILYPDQHDLGTLFLPNTVAMIRGAPHPAAAQRLIDFLLSPEVEAALAAGPAAQFPLNRTTTARARLPGPDEVRAMSVDFAAAATQAAAARRVVEQRFLVD